MAIDFKSSQHPKDITLYAVFSYARYAGSYHGLEEIMRERGVEVDHATLNRPLSGIPRIPERARG